MTIPDLAETLRRIADDGPDEFYTGETAALIVAEMKRGGGLISAADLAAYRPVWRKPVAGEYRGYRPKAASSLYSFVSSINFGD